MSANHHFIAWQQTDPKQPHCGAHFVDDMFGDGETVAGPFDDPAEARNEAAARNGAAFMHGQHPDNGAGRTGYAGMPDVPFSNADAEVAA